MTRTQVLISGASIAGPAVAYWLRRNGFEVTIVERTPAPRPGGQAIDVRGPALEVVERMGLGEQLREHATRMRGMSMVDAGGNEVYRSTERTFSGGELDSPDVEIMRDDLADLLIGASAGVEYLFDDTITELTEDETGVQVAFARSAPRRFDMVIGADGLHSTVRRLVFGVEKEFISHLGSYLAVFTTPNFLGMADWQIFHQGGATGGGVMTAPGNTEARMYVGFESEVPLNFDHRDIEAQKRILAERVTEFPWSLTYMDDAPDFHFDPMAQIHLDRWSRGRVVLLGDAGYCGSPMSGQGTSMALVGAYVLAGELASADGDHVAAFAAYEESLREYVTANQNLALTNKERMAAELAGEPVPAHLPDATEVVNGLRLPDYR